MSEITIGEIFEHKLNPVNVKVVEKLPNHYCNVEKIISINDFGKKYKIAEYLLLNTNNWVKII